MGHCAQMGSAVLGVSAHALVAPQAQVHPGGHGQSPASLHPQAPLPRHAAPVESPAQLAQMPDAPHAVWVVPGTHVVPSQHPPLHGWPGEHVVEQVPVETSQAWPVGQPVGPEQPESAVGPSAVEPSLSEASPPASPDAESASAPPSIVASAATSPTVPSIGGAVVPESDDAAPPSAPLSSSGVACGEHAMSARARTSQTSRPVASIGLYFATVTHCPAPLHSSGAQHWVELEHDPH